MAINIYTNPSGLTELTPEDLAQDAYDVIQGQFPEWTPSEAEYEAWLIEAVSQIVSVLMQVAADVPASIFRYFGSLVGIVPDEATSAVVDATFVMQDTDGYTIPAGTPVGINAAGDTVAGFTTVSDGVVPPGEDEIRLQLRAVEAGGASSGLGALGIERADSLAFVFSITLDGLTQGGRDAETDEAFLNRLSTQLRLMAPRPLEPEEFAQFARTVAGVYRVLALNTYDPVSGRFDREGWITVVPVDVNGDPVASPIRDAIVALLQTNRVLGVRVNVIDPTYTRLEIAYEGVATAGYDPVVVQASADAAVYALISRAVWGSGQSAGTWIDDRHTLRMQDVTTALNNVEGFDYHTNLTINGGTVDVRLNGPASLPRSDSTVTGRVVEPT